MREDSAEADLFRLLVRDLSTGGVIRQHRETTGSGEFVRKVPARRPKGSGTRLMKSAFDDRQVFSSRVAKTPGSGTDTTSRPSIPEKLFGLQV